MDNNGYKINNNNSLTEGKEAQTLGTILKKIIIIKCHIDEKKQNLNFIK